MVFLAYYPEAPGEAALKLLFSLIGVPEAAATVTFPRDAGLIIYLYPRCICLPFLSMTISVYCWFVAGRSWQDSKDREP